MTIIKARLKIHSLKVSFSTSKPPKQKIMNGLLLFISGTLQNTPENPNPGVTFMNTRIVSKDAFQYITRTLEGLMMMDSVKKKLEKKNIIVNIVEKKWLSSKNIYKTSNSFTSGYMQSSKKVNKDGEVNIFWAFVPDNDTQSYFDNGNRPKK